MNTPSQSIALNIANFRTQMLSSLMNLGADAGSSFGSILANVQAGNESPLSALNLNGSVGANALSSSGGLTATLSDPGSAYMMMTKINTLDVTYKSQYSELSQMDSYLPRIAAAAEELGKTATTDANDSIKTRLQDFVQQYNAWVQRFSPDVQPGGVLENTQAGEIPLYELDQVIENRFIGAKDDLRGLADLGVSVDKKTHLVSLDGSRLDAALKSDKQAVVDALGEFSTKLAASANLLASDDNLIQHRLNNLGGAISYIDGNLGSWKQEFGTGDAANPNGQVQRALAAYSGASGI